MKIKELMDKLKEIADKNPDANISIGVMDGDAGLAFGITDKFNFEWPTTDDIFFEVELADLVGKDSISRLNRM